MSVPSPLGLGVGRSGVPHFHPSSLLLSILLLASFQSLSFLPLFPSLHFHGPPPYSHLSPLLFPSCLCPLLSFLPVSVCFGSIGVGLTLWCSGLTSLFLLLVFWGTPSTALGLLLPLCSEITPGELWRTQWDARIVGQIVCKVKALPSVSVSGPDLTPWVPCVVLAWYKAQLPHLLLFLLWSTFPIGLFPLCCSLPWSMFIHTPTQVHYWGFPTM